MRALLLLLAACAAEPVAPDTPAECRPPMDGWYRQSDSCDGVVRMTRARFNELASLRDAFVVYAETCGDCPLAPPIPGVVPAGDYVEGDCDAWQAWDAAMTQVADACK